MPVEGTGISECLRLDTVAEKITAEKEVGKEVISLALALLTDVLREDACGEIPGMELTPPELRFIIMSLPKERKERELLAAELLEKSSDENDLRFLMYQIEPLNTAAGRKLLQNYFSQEVLEWIVRCAKSEFLIKEAIEEMGPSGRNRGLFLLGRRKENLSWQANESTDEFKAISQIIRELSSE